METKKRNLIATLGAVAALSLVAILTPLSSDASTLDTGKFCVAASGYEGKFTGKSGNCQSEPQAERFNASFEVGWMCGGTNDPCRDMEIRLTGFTQAPTGAGSLSANGTTYAPVVSSNSISWSVPGEVLGDAGSVSFDFHGTEAQIMAVQASITSSSGETEIQVNRNF